MVNEQNDLKLPAALRMAANSSRTSGRKFILVNEEEGLQLPPALRIAANTGRGKKQKKHSERMTLKNDAKEMRRRLEQMEDKTDMTSVGNNSFSIGTTSSRQTQRAKGVEGKPDANTTLKDEVAAMRQRLARMEDKTDSLSKETKNISIGATRAYPTPGPRNAEKKSGRSSVKYSNEVLNKKIKKVEKLLDKSAPRSKEFRALKKKLVEYQSQLKQQNQQGDTCITMDCSFTISENECKEYEEEQEQGTVNSDTINSDTINSDTIFEEIAKEEAMKLNENRDQNIHSLEMLKKKLKKVDKMIEETAYGSHDHQKLQKKRISYVSQIKEQEGIELVAEDGERKNRLREYEEADKAYQNALRQQARLSLQRALEKKQREKGIDGSKKGEQNLIAGRNRREKSCGVEKEVEDSSRKERVRVERSDFNSSKKDVIENVVSSDCEPSQYNYFTQYDEDKNTRKKAFLEEARRLKHEALDRKNREDKTEQGLKRKGDEMVPRNEPYQSGMSEKDNNKSKRSDVNEVSKTVFVDNNDQKRKQAFLEEARRLKQQALEKIAKEKQQRESTKENDQQNYEKAMHLSALPKSMKEDTKSENFEESFDSKYVFVDNDAHQRKKAFLEEARRLKQDALEKKAKEEKVREESKANDQQHDKKSSVDVRRLTNEEMKSNNSETIKSMNYVFVDHDKEAKKQAYVEEARRLILEAKRKKSLDVGSIKARTDGDHESEEVESTHEERSVSTESSKIEDDDQVKKQAYLEEARRLKQEAIRKKSLDTKYRNEEKEENHELQDVESIEEERIQTIESSKKFDDDQTKKQAYLEEARILKQEAMRKKSMIEDEYKKEEKQDDDESQDVESIEEERMETIESSKKFDDDQTKKQAYLEEARMLKQEAMRKKSMIEDEYKKEEKQDDDESQDDESETTGYEEVNDESHQKDCSDDQDENCDFSNLFQSSEEKGNKLGEHNEFDLFPEPTTQAKETTFVDHIGSNVEQKNRDEKEGNFGRYPDSMAGGIKKSDNQNEIESKVDGNEDDKHQNISIQSAGKKPNFLEEIKSTRRNPEKEIVQKKPTSLEDIRSKAEVSREEEHSNLSIPSTDNKPNFLEEIKSRRDAKKEKAHNNIKKSYFLDEIKSRTKGNNEDKHQSVSIPLSGRKPSFLEEIKLKADVKIQDENKRKKPNILEDIKAKASGEKKDKHQNVIDPSTHKKPNFLEELRSKTAGENKDGNQNVSSSKLNFLEEIKSKSRVQVEKDTKDDVFSQSAVSSVDRGNPNLMKGINSEGEKHKEVQQGDNPSSCEARFQQSKQLKPEGTGTVKSSTKDKTVASPVKQREEVSKDYLDRRTLVEPLSNNTKKILRELENNEIRQKKLEKALIQNGIRVNEDISYEEAKDKIAEISDSMKALFAAGMESYTAEKEYFRLEEQLSKYTTALMLTDEYADEHRRLEQDWEDSIEADNTIALGKLRSHMPVKIRHLTEEELVTIPSPNGKTLPKPIARKFKRTNILQLLRVDPADIEKMHPSLLEGMRTTGLILIERRALHQHFKEVVERWTEKRSDPSIEKKWQWYQNLRLKFKETLGNQCPIKANAAINYNDDYGYTKEAMYENSSNNSKANKGPQRSSSISKERSAKATKSSEVDIIEGFRDRLCLDANETEVDKKLLRELLHSNRRTKSLEKQLTLAGLSLPKEDIPYDVAKIRIAELTKELNEVAVNMGNTTDAKLSAKLEFTFGKLSEELDKYNNALMLTKEWAQEQKDKERQWEIDVSAANYEALRKVRRHMPVNVRNLSESSLSTDLTPNGKVLPKALARKFKRTNILMILRTDPSVIEVMHPSSLEAMRTTGLTLTERRAIHEHLKDVAPKWKAMATDKMCERKWMWHASLQSKLKEMIGNQRHIQSDLATDYSGDYGYPEDTEYEQQAVAKSNLLSMEELEKRRLEDEYS